MEQVAPFINGARWTLTVGAAPFINGHSNLQLQVGAAPFIKGATLQLEPNINMMLPRPHHPDLATVKDRHPTRALAVAIHYHLRKKMYPHFPASQTEIADLFAVEWKKFFTSVTGREYEGG